jgi:CheY-like chemotaxis protein
VRTGSVAVNPWGVLGRQSSGLSMLIWSRVAVCAGRPERLELMSAMVPKLHHPQVHARAKRHLDEPHALSFLLAEHDDEHATGMRLMMKEYRVANDLHRVRDGQECMAYLRRSGAFAGVTRPDVVLLDLWLPVLDGQQVLLAMHADPVLRSIPVVVMSTFDDPVQRSKAKAAGAAGFLVKPVDFGRFTSMVREMNLFWSVWNHPPE